MKALRILVVDDHAVVRRGLYGLLEAQPGWTVAGEAANGWEAIEKVNQLKPDVVVLDISMPEMDGLEVTRRILETAPRTAVLIFTVHNSAQMVREARKAGARGYVLKSDPAGDIVAAVDALSRHETFFTSGMAKWFPEVAGKDREGS
jgi:DNA-binding NarL/FixJ family response regulator